MEMGGPSSALKQDSEPQAPQTSPLPSESLGELTWLQLSSRWVARSVSCESHKKKLKGGGGCPKHPARASYEPFSMSSALPTVA